MPGSADMDGHAASFQFFPAQAFSGKGRVHSQGLDQMIFFCDPFSERTGTDYCAPWRGRCRLVYARYAGEFHCRIQAGNAEELFDHAPAAARYKSG
jgi:hypothetical protein